MSFKELDRLRITVATVASGSVLVGFLVLASICDSGDSDAPAVTQHDELSTREPYAAPAGSTWPTPIVLDRDATRPDCPEGWQHYNDARGYFSICYPPDVAGMLGISGAGAVYSISSPLDQQVPRNGFVLLILWTDRSWFLPGQAPSLERCATNTGDVGPTSWTSFETRTIEGRMAIGCHWQGGRRELGQGGQLRLDIPFAKDGTATRGYIRIALDYVGPDLDGMVAHAELILATLKLP